MKKFVTCGLISIGSLLLSGATLANPPKPNVYDDGNKWRITFYNDSTSNHTQWATQEICFLPFASVGTSIQGVWYSTSFPDWNGRYYQEGDEVKITGDYARDIGHDHMTLVHTTGKMAFKDWTEWREDGRFGNIIGWGNAKMVRAGRCFYPPGVDKVDTLTTEARKKMESEVQDLSRSLPGRLTIKGELAQSPGQTDLESLDGYLGRVGVR